jgi:hypothetical protein
LNSNYYLYILKQIGGILTMGLLPSKFNAADKKVIGDIVAQSIKDILKPEEKEVQPEKVVKEIADPLVIACEKRQAEIIANLPMDQVMIRGRRGTQLVNRGAESLNTIEETLKAKTHMYTRTNVK